MKTILVLLLITIATVNGQCYLPCSSPSMCHGLCSDCINLSGIHFCFWNPNPPVGELCQAMYDDMDELSEAANDELNPDAAHYQNILNWYYTHC